MSRVSQNLDRVRVTFDDDNLVANAGLLLPATLVERLDVEALISQRGTTRFVNELVARARRDDRTRKLTIRFDAGFWSNATLLNLTRLDVRYTMAIRTSVSAVHNAIEGIADEA